jgi:hypothetical protein
MLGLILLPLLLTLNNSIYAHYYNSAFPACSCHGLALGRNFGGIANCGIADHPAGRPGRDEIG